MIADDWVKIIGALASLLVLLIGALGAVYVQVKETHHIVNSRMDQLLQVTEVSSRAAGRLEGPQRIGIREGEWTFDPRRGSPSAPPQSDT